MPLKVVSLAVLAITLGASPVLACTPSKTAQADVTATMVAMYAAAAKDDLDGFHAVTTPDFYAFDGGKRFDGDALPLLVKAGHAKGMVLVWTVQQPDVHVSCEEAWITYTNVGSVTDATGTRPMTWLESAVLVPDHKKWRIRFFSSTRVPQS